MNEPSRTPSALGYRMPAEWEPHSGTWISWPHNLETWPDELAHVEETMVQVVGFVAPGETVHINVLDAEHERRVRASLDQGSVRGSVRFHHIPTNDAWARDHGAIFVLKDGTEAPLAATNWGFNSWGGKYPPWVDDNRVPPLMAHALGVPVFDGEMILEGGSIEVNGAGVLLTTEACLLNPNRNPHLTREAVEGRLRDMLGVGKVLWLHDGIVGDDTDGHIDDISRFVGERHILTVVEEDPLDDNYEVLQDNLERLRGMTDVNGRPFHVSTLPNAAVRLRQGGPDAGLLCQFLHRQ